jgi:hypothetical protein
MSAAGVSPCEREISVVNVTQSLEGMYLGELSALPATPPSVGDMYIEDDYFLASSDFTGTDSQAYTGGVPYEYDGSSWHNVLDLSQAANTDKALQALGGVMRSGSAVPSTASMWGWFANLVAQNAVIRNLFAQAINIMTGGYIRGGERYLDDNTGTMASNAWDKPGFWFGADGRLMANLQSDANNNTFVGTDVANANASVGSYNTAMGYGALHSNASGGDYNIAFGDKALYKNTTGDYNIAIGHMALSQSSTNSHNIGIGYQSLVTCTSGTHNIGIGYYSLAENISGSYNIGIGYNSLCENVSSSYNVGLGYETLYNATGASNIAIGYQALHSLTTGASNIAIGTSADVHSPTGSYQMNINNSLIYLEFKRGRTYGEMFDVLINYFNSSSATTTATCMGVMNDKSIVKIQYAYSSSGDQITIYYADTSGYRLYSGSTTTTTSRTLLFFVNPTMSDSSRDDCLS